MSQPPSHKASSHSTRSFPICCKKPGYMNKITLTAQKRWLTLSTYTLRSIPILLAPESKFKTNTRCTGSLIKDNSAPSAPVIWMLGEASTSSQHREQVRKKIYLITSRLPSSSSRNTVSTMYVRLYRVGVTGATCNRHIDLQTP